MHRCATKHPFLGPRCELKTYSFRSVGNKRPFPRSEKWTEEGVFGRSPTEEGVFASVTDRGRGFCIGHFSCPGKGLPTPVPGPGKGLPTPVLGPGKGLQTPVLGPGKGLQTPVPGRGGGGGKKRETP